MSLQRDPRVSNVTISKAAGQKTGRNNCNTGSKKSCLGFTTYQRDAVWMTLADACRPLVSNKFCNKICCPKPEYAFGQARNSPPVAILD